MDYDGPPDLWASDLALDDIVLEVTYESGKDFRTFHIGGRVTARSGTTLTLAPPTVGRDWNDKLGPACRDGIHPESAYPGRGRAACPGLAGHAGRRALTSSYRGPRPGARS